MRTSVLVVVCAVMAVSFAACGQKIKPTPTTGDEDAGAPVVDAGRARGEDPPKGWSTPIELPAGAAATTKLGVSLAAIPDQFGQPVVAGVYDDPNGDGDRHDTRVFFTRWNGTDKAFQAQVQVEVVGEVDLSGPNRQVSLARDEVTGQLAIAYVKGADTIRLATSDDEGANFTLATVATASTGTASNPSVAVKGGVVHVAWVDGTTVQYGKRAAGANAFTVMPAPYPAGTSRTVRSGLALGLDSPGNPGLAFFAWPAADDTPSLAFWRPPAFSSTVIASSGTVTATAAQPDRSPSVSLAFSGELPRVAFHLRMVEPLATLDNTTELSYAAATDAGGVTWGTPVGIPRNGDATKFNSTRWYQALVVEASGKVSVAANYAVNGTTGGLCGGPKLARSDNGTLFQTCSPAGSVYGFAGEYVNAWAHSPGKLTLLFAWDTRGTLTAKPGIAMWREP